MVGTEFSAILDLKVDKAYSSFLTTTEKNRIVKEAIIKTLQLKYKELDEQGERDQLSAFIKTNQVFTPSSNQVFLSNVGSPYISDYSNLFSVKAKFAQLIPGLAITNATNATPILVTFTGYNNIRTGEQLTISGVVGNPAANGTFYVNKINNNQFKLYSDKSLTTGVAGNGTYSSGGTISRVFYNYCQPLVSDKKIDPYAQGTVRVPRFEIANQAIKIYPSDSTCSEISVDYLAIPSLFIDVSNGSTDIELTYPIDLLYDIADRFAQLFSESFKDGDLFQMSNFEIQKNNQ